MYINIEAWGGGEATRWHVRPPSEFGGSAGAPTCAPATRPAPSPAAPQESGRPENLVGWYHSHPGYGCWLSGIDVGTQMTNQKYTVRLHCFVFKYKVMKQWQGD